uniref:Tumor necrosis factor receptor superfamily member wengen n=1 Tax=Drosophila pseudoobscura pseudoobscura TaxID=46245 RepID=B5DVE3_DROPS
MMPPRLPHSSGVAAAAATKRVTTSRSISSHNNHFIHSRSTTNTTFHKRRRRRHDISNATDATSDATIAPASARCSITRRAPAIIYLALLLLSTTCSLRTVAASSASSTSSSSAATTSASASGSGSASEIASSSPCAPQHWWDPLRDKCTACTVCLGEMIPLRPCQLHTNTICGSIYDLKIDWVVLAKTEPNWKERRKSSEYEHFEQDAPLQHLTHEQLQQLHEEAAAAWVLDWQTGVLYVAVLTCLIFFSVAACILIHHMRQWRRMERRLDQDVEELSTKLMAKLAEVQSLDGGTFFIGNADALRGLPAAAASHAASAAQSGIFQPQHVLLPEKHQGKHQERRILKTLQPGNVYIEENNGGMMGIGASSKG